MNRRAVRNLLVGISAAAAVATANASTVQFMTVLDSNGTELSSPFASMSIDSVAGDVFSFDFSFAAFDLNSIFNPGAYVSRIAVDTIPDLSSTAGMSTSLISGGVSTLTVASGNGGAPGGAEWDFRFDFGSGNDRLTAGETVTWRTTFASEIDAMHFASKVSGLGGAGKGNAWYAEIAAPVPEPETWAMLLPGLVLAGIAVRRRSKGAGAQR